MSTHAHTLRDAVRLVDSLASEEGWDLVDASEHVSASIRDAGDYTLARSVIEHMRERHAEATRGQLLA